MSTYLILNFTYYLLKNTLEIVTDLYKANDILPSYGFYSKPLNYPHKTSCAFWYSVGMLDHHIQRAIVTKLKSSDSLSFTELKDGDLDNKLFTYHLKATIREKFVEKTKNGRYRLTPAGEKLWRRMSETPEKISLRAFCVLYLVVHHAKYGWLLYRRKTHPLKDKVGFMHAIPDPAVSVAERASNELASKTGLKGTFNVIGSGFFRTMVEGMTYGYNNFTMLLCEDSTGTLSPTDDAADYFWSKQINATDQELLPNMPTLLGAIADGSYPFFVDKVVGA